jgi:hypothetical protein
MILIRYAMRGFELGEELLSVATFALLNLIESLSDALVSVGAGRNVEQALILFSVLNDSLRLALDREDYRPPALF